MKKIISLALAVCCFILVFSSCKNNTSGNNTSKNGKIASYTIEDIDGKKYTIDITGDYVIKKVEKEEQISDKTFPAFQYPAVDDEIAEGKFSLTCTSSDGKTNTIAFESNFFTNTKMAFNLNKLDKYFKVMDNKNVPDFLSVEFLYRDSDSSRARHLFAIKDGQLVEVNHTVKQSTTKGFVYGVKFLQNEEGNFIDTLVSGGMDQMSNQWHYDNATATLIWDKIIE